jgi:hypothetical protein
MFKKFSILRIFVEKIYKMGCFEGSGVPRPTYRTHGS